MRGVAAATMVSFASKITTGIETTTMKLTRAVLLVLAASLLGYGLRTVTPASADSDAPVITELPVAISCTSVATQLCVPAFSTTVVSAGILQVEFIASSGHCSKIRVFIFLDGNLRATSVFLDPGQSSGVANLSPVFGTHVVSVQAEGTTDPITGGGTCNAGSLGGWAGTLRLTTGGEGQQVLTVQDERRLLVNNSGVAAGIAAIGAKASAANRARAAQQAAAAVAPPVVTAPNTGTGIVSPSAAGLTLPSTGDAGLKDRGASSHWYALILLALLGFGGASAFGAYRMRRP